MTTTEQQDIVKNLLHPEIESFLRGLGLTGELLQLRTRQRLTIREIKTSRRIYREYGNNIKPMEIAHFLEGWARKKQESSNELPK